MLLMVREWAPHRQRRTCQAGWRSDQAAISGWPCIMQVITLISWLSNSRLKSRHRSVGAGAAPRQALISNSIMTITPYTIDPGPLMQGQDNRPGSGYHDPRPALREYPVRGMPARRPSLHLPDFPTCCR